MYHNIKNLYNHTTTKNIINSAKNNKRMYILCRVIERFIVYTYMSTVKWNENDIRNMKNRILFDCVYIVYAIINSLIYINLMFEFIFNGNRSREKK